MSTYCIPVPILGTEHRVMNKAKTTSAILPFTTPALPRIFGELLISNATSIDIYRQILTYYKQNVNRLFYGSNKFHTIYKLLIAE